ncbi:C-C motif chemokine 28 [Mergus octosetaceus]
MDVNLVTVLVLLTVAVSQTSETLFPGAFNCCTKISDEIPKGILPRVERFEIQKADGLCHLEAKKKHKIAGKKTHGRKQRRSKNNKKREKQQ